MLYTVAVVLVHSTIKRLIKVTADETTALREAMIESDKQYGNAVVVLREDNSVKWSNDVYNNYLQSCR